MRARPSWAGLVASMAVHSRQMRALSAYRFDAARIKSVRMPTLLLIGQDTVSPYAKRSIDALRESLPNAAVAVLERQEHNAMEGGRDVLAKAIIKFAAGKECRPRPEAHEGHALAQRPGIDSRPLTRQNEFVIGIKGCSESTDS